MISNRGLVNALSISLAVILLTLAFTLTLIAIFFPEVLGDGFDMSGYESEFGELDMGELPDLNGILGDLNCDGNGGGGGGGGMDLSRVIFKVFATESVDGVYFRQGSYVTPEGNVWYEAEPFVSTKYPDRSATYFSGEYILRSTGAMEKTMMIESLDGTVVMPYYSTGGLDLPETVFPYAEENYKYSLTYVDYADVSRISDMSRYVKEYETYARETYLSLAPDTEAYMKKLIKNQGFSANDPDVVEKVAEYVRSAKKYDMEFDPALEEEANIAVAFLDKYESGVCRHFAASATMIYRALGIPARYTVGYYSDVSANQWSEVIAKQAHAWVEIFVSGFGWVPVEVTPSLEETPPDNQFYIEIKPEDIEVQGDMYTTVKCDSIEGFEEYAKRGYYYDVTISGEQKGLGITQTVISDITIYDINGDDVTSSFDIYAEPGYIQVYYSELYYWSSSAAQVYNGSIFTCDEINENGNKYYGKHSVFPTFLAGTVDVGTVANVFVVTVFDEKGNDITSHYKIGYGYGELEVTHASVSLKAADAEKWYDGTALECHEFEFVENNLAPGHYIDGDIISIVGSQIERGRSENIIDIDSIVIRDEYGRDVTSNYMIKTYAGQLRVR